VDGLPAKTAVSFFTGARMQTVAWWTAVSVARWRGTVTAPPLQPDPRVPSARILSFAVISTRTRGPYVAPSQIRIADVRGGRSSSPWQYSVGCVVNARSIGAASGGLLA